MYLNDKEESIIGKLLFLMEKSSDKDKYEFAWESGTTVIGSPVATYESDNGLEVDEPGFEEYWAIAIKIINVIKSGPEIGEISPDGVFEISYHNVPIKYSKL